MTKQIEYVKVPGVAISVNKEMVAEFEGKIVGLEVGGGAGWHRVVIDTNGKKLFLLVHNNRMNESPLRVGDSVKGFCNPTDTHVWHVEKI